MSAIDARDLALEVLLRIDSGVASDRAVDRGLQFRSWSADRGLWGEVL